MPDKQYAAIESGFADTHFHLWDMEANYYPWLVDQPLANPVFGEYSALKKNYLVEDFLADARDVPLVKGVHIEADHDTDDPVRETRWLQSVADSPASRGLPHGIVAYCDLGLPGAERILRAHCEFRNTRGLRQTGRGLAVEVIEDPTYQANFRLLRELGLSYDLRVRHPDMGTAARLVRLHPDTQFIVTHTGYRMSEDAEYVTGWRSGMRALAAFPNVAVKISGFGFMDRNWTDDYVRLLARETIDIFGADRCMFASNFPVDKLSRGYTAYWTAFARSIADFSPDERRQLMLANAERIYRI